jgi:hypothetical protein
MKKQISCAQVTINSWYENIKFYLTHGSTPDNIDPKIRRALRLKSASFQLINDVLFRKNFDGVLMRCLEKEESEKVLSELHVGEFWWSLRWRYHCSQSAKSWVLLAHFV